MLASEGHGDGSGENSRVYNGMSVDAQSSRNGIDTGETEIANNRSSLQFLSNFKKDSQIWKPPEPEHVEDDMDGVANDDDDHDYSDGEKHYSRSMIEMIDIWQPNVVLVEKTVSRDIRDFLLAKGITLVFDMKLSRLRRITRFSHHFFC
ncbi:hypothetical protein COCNU_04G009380 [Cocos nucifera]|uniref:Uncharacterized protein n=1 Tax=Cocos nucifera TaxID=13894 RepID=A0A8K0N0F3_COCNU|nr:hypothetical protein COCNU_04G009380 [Cocos nucifera]